MLFKRKPTLFSEVNKQTKAKIKEIKKIHDPEQRLAKYEALQESFKNLYGNEKVQKSVEHMYSLGYEVKSNTGAFSFMAGGCGLLLSVPLLVSGLAPVVLPSLAALSASTAVAARQLTYRSEAKRLGLETRDAKFAVRTERLQEQVEKTIKSLSLEIEKKKALENLQNKFNQGVAGKPVAAAGRAAQTQPPVQKIRLVN